MSNELTKYGAIDPNWAVQRLEQLKKDREEKKSRAGFLKLPEGKTFVRIAPPWKPGLPSAVKEAWLHKIKDPADLKAPPKITIPCDLKNGLKTSCRVCNRCKELKNTGSPSDRELAYQWYAQQRFFAAALNIEQSDRGWQVWEFGDTVFGQYLRITQPEELEGSGDITHPVSGRSLIVDRTGTGMKDTRYDIRASNKPSKFPRPELLNELLDLDLMTQPWDLDAIEKALRGEDLSVAPANPDEPVEGDYTPPKGSK